MFALKAFFPAFFLLAMASNVLSLDFTIITSVVGGYLYDGDMNGYAGANLYCQSANGGNSSNFIALLYGNPDLGNTTIINNFYNYEGQLVVVGSFDQIFGTDPPDLLNIITDIFGKTNASMLVWTGAADPNDSVHHECILSGEVWQNNDVSSERGTFGRPQFSAEWISAGSGYCYDQKYLLYCIEIKGSGRGDPHFVGFDGCKFDFDGVAGSVFSLYADKTIQVNALFEQLALDVSDGNWMTKLGVRVGDESFILDPNVGILHSENNTIYNTPNVVQIGENRLHMEFNNGLVSNWILENSQLKLNVEVKRFLASSNDYFINVDFELRSTPVNPHGILGQTVRPVSVNNKNTNSAAVRNCPGGVEGGVQDYIVRDGILGTDFTFQRFGLQQTRQVRSYDSISVQAKMAKVLVI